MPTDATTLPPATAPLPPPRLTVLLFSDIVGSVQLKTDLGTDAYARLLGRHNDLFRTSLDQFPTARVLQTTGDGFLASFPTPSDAVRFALRFQSRMGLEPWQPRKIESRVGIHLGEIRSLEAAAAADADPDQHIVGLAIDLTSRIMSLGCGGQILLTRAVFDDARQFVRQSPESFADTPPLKWLNHGPYRFKGSEDFVEVCEVGIENFSPLRPPESTDKVRRVVPHDQEEMFGPANPRPATGFDIPGKPHWRLVRKLGEGGFGEVWLAEHEKLKDHRVFKFCFNADRLRSLKREYTLFRLIKEALGDRPDIARLYEYNLERPPFFLESEFTNGGSLADWADSIGGIDKVSQRDRLELLAKVAGAVAAAHSVGILHKDIKPSNILIQTEPSGRVQPRLADFGIGLLADRTTLQNFNVTETGFTQITELADGGSSRTGTRMYAPPESVTNQPFTTAGDVYALGILYYQMAVGDLSRPLAEGWRTDVDDEILRDDIARCVDRDPAKRPASAAAVAEMIRTIDQRRSQRAAERAAADSAARRARRRRIARAATAAALLLLALAAAATVYHVRNVNAEQAKTVAALQNRDAVLRFLTDEVLANATPEKIHDAKVRDEIVRAILDPAAAQVGAQFQGKPLSEAAVRHVIATSYRKLSRGDLALPQIVRAEEIRRSELGPDNPDTLASETMHALVLEMLGRAKEAEALHKDALDRLTRTLGPDHPERLAALNNYAMVLKWLGRAKEAEPLAKEALDRRRKVLGLDHPDTLASLNNYALILQALGRAVEAEPLHKDALERRKKALGEDHPDTLASLNNYAIVINTLGQGDKAAELLKDALDRRRRVLGPDHRNTLGTLMLYGFVLNQLGRPAEAEPLFLDAIERNTRLYGEDHPSTLNATNGYVVVLNNTSHADKAAPIAKRALDLATANPNMGPKHPDTIQLAWNYAEALKILGRNDEERAVTKKYALPR